MAKFRIQISIESFNTVVEADTEEEAKNIAYDQAWDFYTSSAYEIHPMFNSVEEIIDNG